MLVRLILLGALAASLAAVPAARQPAGAQPAPTALPAACDLAASGAESGQAPTTESTLAAGLPAGIALAVLAEQPSERWPGFVRGLVLTVRHLTLAPGADSTQRRTSGPLLFYVETGTVGISINSRLQPYEQGAAALVETNQYYLLRNDTAAPATVLRLALVPPGEETTVGRRPGEIAVIRGVEEPAGPEPIDSRLLLSADVPVLAGRTRLFLACLSWTDPAADPGEAAHPGPVGLVVLHGQLLVGETGDLGEGGCVLFQPQAPHRLRAGDPPPVVLVVGAVPEGAQLWSSPTAGAEPGPSTVRFTVRCGEPEQPDDGSEAASVLPSHALHRE
jgi:quercetin dioxygenase-like cupin family protein